METFSTLNFSRFDSINTASQRPTQDFFGARANDSFKFENQTNNNSYNNQQFFNNNGINFANTIGKRVRKTNDG